MKWGTYIFLQTSNIWLNRKQGIVIATSTLSLLQYVVLVQEYEENQDSHKHTAQKGRSILTAISDNLPSLILHAEHKQMFLKGQLHVKSETTSTKFSQCSLKTHQFILYIGWLYWLLENTDSLSYANFQILTDFMIKYQKLHSLKPLLNLIFKVLGSS